jgi:hypothetical protein
MVVSSVLPASKVINTDQLTQTLKETQLAKFNTYCNAELQILGIIEVLDSDNSNSLINKNAKKDKREVKYSEN